MKKIQEWFKKIRQREDGFGLVEMVVVVGIMLTLSAAAVPMTKMAYERKIAAQTEAVDEAAGKTFETAWEWFYDQNPETDPLFAADIYNEAAVNTIEVEVIVDDSCVLVKAWDIHDNEFERFLCSAEPVVDREL